LKAAIDEKRSELSNHHDVAFHQDNARSHVSLTTRQKLLQFGWDVLPHTPYSYDIAPSDRIAPYDMSPFHFLKSLQNSLIGKNSLLWKIAKSTLKNFSLIKLGSFRRMKFSNCLKGAKLLKKTINTLLSKIIF